METLLLLVVLIPTLALANNQCKDGDIHCPPGKTCCHVNGQYDCCESSLKGVSSASFNTPLQKQGGTSGNTTIQHGFSALTSCDWTNCPGTCCSDQGCCQYKNANCCNRVMCCMSDHTCCSDRFCCERGTTCCSNGCCPYANAICCSADHCCPSSSTCCTTGCCPKRNAVCCPGDRCCDAGTDCCGDSCCLKGTKCCGDWCCESSQKCGSTRDTCDNAGTILNPTIMNLLGLALLSCIIKYRFL